MAVINSNLVSLVTQSNLHKSKNSLHTAFNRLASGLRINSAKDDAAGQSIANRLSSSTLSLAQAKRNTQDGLSLISTTEGALSNLNHNLLRIRDLTVQAKNGSNSQADLDIIQLEIDSILANIDNISQYTQFNNIFPLKIDTQTVLQIGMNDGDKFPFNLKAFDTKALGLDEFQINKEPLPPIHLDDPQRINTNQVIEFLEIYAPELVGELDQNVSANNLILGVDNSIFGLSNNSIQPVHVVTDDFNNFYLQVQLDPQTAEDRAKLELQGMNINEPHFIPLSLADFSISYVEDQNGQIIDTRVNVKFQNPNITLEDFIPLGGIYEPQSLPVGSIGEVDLAISMLDEYRSYLVSIFNRLESTANYLGVSVNMAHLSRSRIEDADFAIEMSEVTRSMILQNAANSTLAQANQIPSMAVKLLREA